jgi:hypothetical protein
MDAPVCPNHKKGTCERSDPVILAQDDEYYQFGCRTCRCGYVFTTPHGKARAQWKLEMDRRRELQLTNRDRHVFFIAPQGGWNAEV